VCITKYRYKILLGRIAERARDQLREVCQAREAVIIHGAVASGSDPHAGAGAAGHGVGQVGAVSLKGRSSRRLQDEFWELRKRYWGRPLWARGYFGARVGAVDEETIKKYIKNQKWDEQDQGFKITAPTEP
jgi:putative transposase